MEDVIWAKHPDFAQESTLAAESFEEIFSAAPVGAVSEVAKQILFETFDLGFYLGSQASIMGHDQYQSVLKDVVYNLKNRGRH